ncbi:MAG: VCBS repeat-containing protein, partial [Planctomycetota bacterium]
MAQRRPRRKLRLILVVVGLAAVAIGVQVVRSRAQGYRAGEGAQGLVDRLARERPDQVAQLRFVEIGREAGLDFQHFPLTRTGRLPEDMGSGVAVGDVDGDGWPDVFLMNAGPLEGAAEGWGEADVRSRLFRNRGDGTFEDITRSSGIDVELIGLACAFVDVDSDADLDLVLTSYGGVRLLQNDGRGHFVDVTRSAGLAHLEGFFSGLAVGDHDLDGALDLYLCRYVVYDEQRASGSSSQFGLEIPAALNPSVFDPAPNVLLRGLGDGTFEDITERAGVGNPDGRSLGAVFTDLDDDGWPDIYVANDVSDNALFLNRGDGTFVDRTNEAMVGDYRGAMGLAVADFDGDLDLDLFITHWLAQENALYAVRLPADDAGASGDAGVGAPQTPLYLDVANRFGLGFPGLRYVGWGTRLVDLDNDGALDLFVVNGSTVPVTNDPTRLVPQT